VKNQEKQVVPTLLVNEKYIAGDVPVYFSQITDEKISVINGIKNPGISSDTRDFFLTIIFSYSLWS